MSRWVFNISTDGNSTASLGILVQCLVWTLSVKSIVLCSDWNSCLSSLCPLLPVLSLGTTEKSWTLSSLHAPIGYLNKGMRAQWAFLSSDWIFPTFYPFLKWLMLQSLNHILVWGVPHWTQYPEYRIITLF